MEASVVGHVNRKRAMSKRLLFIDILSGDGLRRVVLQSACEGVGGAANARSVLKLGDLIRVRGEANDDGTILARQVLVEQAGSPHLHVVFTRLAIPANEGHSYQVSHSRPGPLC